MKIITEHRKVETNDFSRTQNLVGALKKERI